MTQISNNYYSVTWLFRYLLAPSGNKIKVFSISSGNLVEEHNHHEDKVSDYLYCTFFIYLIFFFLYVILAVFVCLFPCYDAQFSEMWWSNFELQSTIKPSFAGSRLLSSHWITIKIQGGKFIVWRKLIVFSYTFHNFDQNDQKWARSRSN